MLKRIQCWLSGYHDVAQRHVDAAKYHYSEGHYLEEYCRHCEKTEPVGAFIGPAVPLHAAHSWFYDTDFGLLEPLAKKLDDWAYSFWVYGLGKPPIWWGA